jgi:heat shock protein HslJ
VSAKWFVTVAMVGLLAGACGNDDAGSGASTTAAGGVGEAIDGRVYLSQSVSEDSEPRPLVEGTQIRLSFEDGRVTATAGCNTMGGEYSVDGATLRVSDLATTEMGCDPERHEQDEWLATFLTAAPELALDGDVLTMATDTTEITLLDREVADPDRPLTGTSWTLDTIIEGEAASSVPAGVTATLRIDDGTAIVDAGCNTGSGSVDVGDDTLTFGPMMLTKRACEADAARVEAAVTGVLAGTVDYEIEADVLRLRAADAGLDYRAG